MNLRAAIGPVLAFSLVACASAPPESSLQLSVAGSRVEVELSRQALVGLLEDGLDTTIDCDGELDRDLRALLERLDRRRVSTASMGEGADRVVASRRGSRLTITVGDRGAGHLRATVPWALGECLLGRDITVEQALGRQPVEVELVGEDGSSLSARLR